MQTLKLKKKYEAYPEYKDSGVEWIGKIPKGWSVTPLRSLASENRQKNSNGKCQNLLSLSYGKIVQKDITSNEGLLPESFNTYQVVEKGNIVFRLTDLQNDKKSLRVGHVDFDEPGIITSAYLALTVDEKVNSKYAYYLFHAYDIQKVFYGMGGGVRQTLDFKNFKYLPTLVPDVEQQKKIVIYIDEQTECIDQIIAKKQKLIELLRQKRTTVINDAMRSPIGSREKLKYVAPERKDKSEIAAGDNRYIGLENVESFTGKIVDSGDENQPESLVKVFKAGDVLFGKLRPYLAKALSADFGGVCSGEFLVLVPNKNKIIPKYLFYKLVSRDFIKAIDDSTYGAKMPRANWQFIGNQVIQYPTLNKQAEIVESLDLQLRFLDELIFKVGKSIELLNEFKSSLISNVVTGMVRA